VTVKVDHRAASGSEDLFRMPGMSATNIHAELRRTMDDRVNAAVEIANASDEQFIVWCYGNDESALLARLINGAVELTGSDKDTVKEDRIAKFLSGKARVLVSKPSIAGSGLNLQCCRNDIYVGLTHSFEQFYQSSKRIHRFGQTREVRRWIIQTDTDDGVMATIMRKQDQHDTMRSLMKFTRENLMEESTFTQMKTDITLATGEDWQLYHGDCVRVARDLPDESVGLSLFSPPFADVFCYSNDIQDMGNCNGLSDFMVQFGYLIDQLSRITMPGRHCAVHCCDLLSTKWKDGEIGFKGFIDAIERAFCGDPNDIISQVSSALTSSIVEKFKTAGWVKHSQITIWKDPVTEMQRTKAHGLLYKTLRSDSSKSRVGSPDYLLVFRKKGDNPVPITHTFESFPLDLWQEIASPVWMTIDQGKVLNGKLAREQADERHICPLQIDVIERALTMWSAKGDTVFSPFTGIGSEGYCSLRMGRKFIGAELKESYWKTACRNLTEARAEQSFF
jgi:DNA modification methylase